MYRFRWAYCQLQELKKLKSTKPKFVHDALRTLPATLDETYERMLSVIERRYHGEALTLLRWLTYAQSPPTLGQLAEASIVDPGVGDGEVDTDNRGDFEDSLDILSGLVVVMRTADDERTHEVDVNDNEDDNDDNSQGSMDLQLENTGLGDGVVGHSNRDRRIRSESKIRLAHFSVKEYLQSERIRDSDARKFYLESAKGHRFIARSCLTYLTYYCSDQARTSTSKDLATYPLLEYAARSWYYHSSLGNFEDVSREASFLASETSRQAWLLVHRPDRSWADAFESVENAGSSLYYAGYTGLEKVVKVLLDKGADINAKGGQFGNALQAASLRGHEKVVETLLGKGADVNAQGGQLGNALQAASSGGHEKVVQMLTTAEADASR